MKEEIPRIKIYPEKDYKTCNNFQVAWEEMHDLMGHQLNHQTLLELNHYQKIFNDCLKCMGKPEGYDATWTVRDIFDYYCTYIDKSLSAIDLENEKVTHNNVVFMLNQLELAEIISEYDNGIYIWLVTDEPCHLDDIVYVKFKRSKEWNIEIDLGEELKE